MTNPRLRASAASKALSPEGLSFDAFVRKHLDLELVRVAKRYASLRGLPGVSVREIVQEALARVWAKDWLRLHDESDDRRLATVYTYMHFVAGEEARNQRRRPWPVAPSELQDSPVGGVEELAMARSTIASLRQALSTLPDEQREVILLAGVAGLSRAEIAAQLTLTPTNVSTILSRARARLRLALGVHTSPNQGIGVSDE